MPGPTTSISTPASAGPARRSAIGRTSWSSELAHALRRGADAAAAALARNPSDAALRRHLASLLEMRLWLKAQDLPD